MNVGDPVEVNVVWAANGPAANPSKAWFKGYAYVGPSPHARGCLLLEVTRGTFKGCLVNYLPADVRPAVTP